MYKYQLVSVIIPSYNAQATIDKTINAIRNQSYKGNIEIVVVDDGSKDNTPKIIQSFQDVTSLHQKKSGPAAARNLGFEKSKGEIVFFTDADCIPHHKWIERALKYFDDQSVGVVCGTYSLGNPESFLAKCIHYEIIFRHIHLMSTHPKSFGSYNFCVRRNIFSDVGGFDTSYRHASGEDNDLSYKILKQGYQIFFALDVIVQHRHPTDRYNYLKGQFRHGFWRLKMYWDHPDMAKGDNYTFWKDICEPLLVFAVILGLVGMIFQRFLLVSASIFIINISILMFLEIFFGFIMMRTIKSAIFFACVMFLRAFYRTFGFLSGFLYFFQTPALKKPSKKIK